MKFTTHKFQKQRSVERNRRAANKKYYLRYKLNEARVDNFLEDIFLRFAIYQHYHTPTNTTTTLTQETAWPEVCCIKPATDT